MFSNFAYEIEVLSPTVVGSGNKIMNFEVIKNEHNELLVIDIYKMLQLRHKGIISLFETLDYGSVDICKIFKDNKIDYTPFIKYKLDLSGTIYKNGHVKEINEFIKTSGKPYIPGSSIKGALRTCLTRNVIKQESIIRSIRCVSQNDSIKEKSICADDIAEKEMFGTTYESPFKLINISDTDTVGYSNLGLCEFKVMNVCNGQVKWFAGKYNDEYINSGISIYTEALKTGTKLRGSLTLKTDVADLQIPDFKFKYINILGDYILKIQNDMNKYIDREIDFYKNNIIPELEDFYIRLKSLKLCKNEFLMQLGFSTGYLSKAVASNINSELIKELKTISNNRDKIYDTLFPKTRRIIIKNGKPYSAFGWIKVTLKGRNYERS